MLLRISAVTRLRSLKIIIVSLNPERMNPSTTLSRWLFAAYVVLTFYCLGAAVITEWLEYRALSTTSASLSAADVAAWNMAGTQPYAYYLSVPSALLTVLVLALFWNLPASVPRGPLWGVLACQLVVWAAFLLTQTPMGVQLEQSSLVTLLVHSDWVRKLALLIEAPLAAYMAFRAYWPAHDPRPTVVLNTSRNTPSLG